MLILRSTEEEGDVQEMAVVREMFVSDQDHYSVTNAFDREHSANRKTKRKRY